MALETAKTLVSFAYANSADKVEKTAGVISFANDTRQIFVGDGVSAVPFAGNVKNATFDAGILTISRNTGDDITLNFSNVADASAVMAVFAQLDNSIKDEATARATADASIRADFEAADTSILNKIGEVAADKTLVEMIQDAEAAAIAAGTVITESDDFITLESSVGENGATTYTIGTTNVAKASDLEKTDASLAIVTEKAHTHENKAELDKIVDGDKAKWDAATTAINEFLTGTGTEEVVDTLKDIQDWMKGEGVDATELTKAIADEAAIRATEDASVLKAAQGYADQVGEGVIGSITASGDSYVDASASDGAITVNLNASTIASLGRADSAVQSITIGGSNGTIAVDGTDVAVKGLGTAAYTNSDAYDAAGTAATEASTALASAKSYADAIKVNGKGQDDQEIVITGEDIKVGGSDAHNNESLNVAIEALYDAVAEAHDAGVQSFAVDASSANYAEVDNNTSEVTFKIKIKDVSTADASNDGLAKSSDVKTYVDNAISAAALKWTVIE